MQEIITSPQATRIITAHEPKHEQFMFCSCLFTRRLDGTDRSLTLTTACTSAERKLSTNITPVLIFLKKISHLP